VTESSLTMVGRVLRELRDNGPARGQTALAQRVLGERYTMADLESFKLALRWHLNPPSSVIETRVQLPGTGLDGPPVYEYIYSVPETAPATQRS